MATFEFEEIAETNKKLEAVRIAFHKVFPAFIIEDSDNHLRLAEEPSDESIERVRHRLVQLRNIHDMKQQSKKNIACHEALHDALVSLAKIKPLNETAHGEIKCGLTGKVIKPGKEVYLSNGYMYRESIFDKFKAGDEFFPRKLGNAEIEIDQQDVQAAQASSKGKSVASGISAGIFMGLGYVVISAVIKTFAGASLTALVHASLITAGASAGVAMGVSLGVFVLPIIALIGIGVGIGVWYFNSKHPTKLEPPADNVPAPKSSTNTSLSKLEVELEDLKKPKNTAALDSTSEVQNLDAPSSVAIILPRVAPEVSQLSFHYARLKENEAAATEVSAAPTTEKTEVAKEEPVTQKLG